MSGGVEAEFGTGVGTGDSGLGSAVATGDEGLDALIYRPDSDAILKSLDADDLEDGTGITTRFYRHFIVDAGNKGMAANLRWRRRMLEACSRDSGLRNAVWVMCKRDILFWVNTFCWTYDPRNVGMAGARGNRKMPKTVPFVTWPYQDDAFRLLEWCVLNGVDGLIEKSRDMGASWIFLTLFDYFFLFWEMNSFMMVSRKEDLVDQKGDPDSLFWKIEFLHENMPGWLLPSTERMKLHFKNLELGGTIDGESTTGDVGRGGRRTAIGLDEFAAVPSDEGFAALNATNDTTECRIFNSTPKGVGNAYHEQTKRDDIVRIRMHWTQHPHKNTGLYYCRKGKCPVHPEGGRPHSPWYDRECRRRGYNTTAIAQELDIDYTMSGGAFFNAGVMEDYIAQVGRFHLFRGELEYDIRSANPYGFQERQDGNLFMWIQPALDGTLPEDDYIIGADIAEGTGASFSCLSVGSARTGEKLAEYMTPLLKPYEFARYAVALARMFKNRRHDGAMLIWEANGPGREFGDQVVTNLGYANVWRRRDILGTAKRSQFPGWVNTADEKTSAFGAYRRALAERTFLNRSRLAIKEALKYVTNDDGVPEYRGAAFNLGRIGQSHGDIVVADVMLNKGFEDFRETLDLDEEEVEREILPNSMAARIAEAQRAARREEREFLSL